MKQVSSTSRSARGFSLIEVLVAVALLAVILLALFSLVSMGVQRAYSGKKMTQATILAQAAMERANVYEAHKLLGAADTATTATQTWTRTKTSTTPAAVTGTSTEALVRDAWRKLLDEADLPVAGDKPATLTVTITPVGAAGVTFATATMERIEVLLVWHEWGTRRRQVRLQALNLRTIP